MFWGEFFLKVIIVLFVLLGICRDCRKSVFESLFFSVVGIMSIDMEEGVVYGMFLIDLELFLCIFGYVVLVWMIIL